MQKETMKYFILIFCLAVFIVHGLTYAQIKKISNPDIYTEGNFYVKDSTLYSDAIVIKFKDRIFDLPREVRYAVMSNINPNFPVVIDVLNKFRQKYGPITLIKQIPGAQWGDTTRRHKITGELVQIEDLSQLFTFIFSQPVPLDSTLNEFLKLSAVEYVHEPVSIVFYDSPNDSVFQAGSQWNLDVVEAIEAWNVTQGNNSIKIGIVDEGTLQNHEDLQGKIVGGDAVEGEHGTWVAGVAGSATNNSEGVASLGWNISLNTYGEGGLEIGSESFIAQNISDAANNSDIINMSFGTLRYAILEDMPQTCPDPAKWIRPNGVFWSVVPQDYNEIKTAVSNAVAQGVICISSAGNSSKNLGQVPSECDPMPVPFASYPAQYPNVIAISGTRLANGVEEFRDGWNYGNLVDVSGPAVGIWTTDDGGAYFNPSGTSFSSPLVSALAGLIKSVDPAYGIADVTDIITTTADKISASNCDGGTSYVNGWNPCLGYGRINAHAAVLEALDRLPARESASPQATTHNAGRRLVKDGSNLYLVYESGNQVYFTKSTDDGSTWSDPPTRLSDGFDLNNFPSITRYNDKLYAVWQKRRSDTNIYDIYFATSQDEGNNWPTSYLMATTQFSSATDPLPVIQAGVTSEFILMVVFRDGNAGWEGLTSCITTNSKPTGTGAWSEVHVPGTGASDLWPSLAAVWHYWNGSTITGLAYANTAGEIYYNYHEPEGNGWTISPINLSNIVSGSAVHQTPSLSGTGNGATTLHVAWYRMTGDGSSNFDHTLIYRKSNGFDSWPDEYTQLYYEQQFRPSITAVDLNNVDVLFQISTGKSIYKQHYDGFNWIGPELMGSGQYPSVSTGSTSAKYVWTSSSGPPYTVELSSETLSKSTSAQPYYTRAINWLDGSGAYLKVHVQRIYFKTPGGKEIDLDFLPVRLDTVENFTPGSAWEYLASDLKPVPAGADSVIVEYILSADDLEKVGESAEEPHVTLELRSSQREVVDSKPGPNFVSSGDIVKSSHRISRGLNDMNSPNLKAVVRVEKLDAKSTTFASLGHIYDFTKTLEKEQPTEPSLATELAPNSTLLLQTYPNPFNPETTIKYTVPQSRRVRLNIYNIQGQVIRTLVDAERASGDYQIRWDGRDARGLAVGSGVYLVRIRVGKDTAVKKVMMLK